MFVTTSIVFLISLWLYILKRRTAYPIPRLQESFIKLFQNCVGWVRFYFWYRMKFYAWQFSQKFAYSYRSFRISKYELQTDEVRHISSIYQFIFFILKDSFFSITLTRAIHKWSFMTNGLTRLCAVRCINVDNSIQMVLSQSSFSS